jgi:hypothetical protein
MLSMLYTGEEEHAIHRAAEWLCVMLVCSPPVRCEHREQAAIIRC